MSSDGKPLVLIPYSFIFYNNTGDSIDMSFEFLEKLNTSNGNKRSVHVQYCPTTFNTTTQPPPETITTMYSMDILPGVVRKYLVSVERIPNLMYFRIFVEQSLTMLGKAATVTKADDLFDILNINMNIKTGFKKTQSGSLITLS
jgi:hypothetical protein